MGRRVAVVTGAAHGIGSATARRLAEDGTAVAVLDHDLDGAEATSESIRAAGGRSVAVRADVTDEEEVADAIELVARELGSPTILVNNAGVLRDNLVFKMSLEDWETVLAVHLRGAFLLSRQVQSHMVEQGWGRIVNVSSTSALGNRGQANYAAAKAGVQGLTKTLAIELGRFGITANCVAPGFIATDMTRRTAERLGVSFDALQSAAADAAAVGRVGTPRDVAAAVGFFAGDDAGFITGQVLYVSGGTHG